MKTEYAITESRSQLVKCEIKLQTGDRKKLIYHGLFRSTAAATRDAINRFDVKTIFVRAL